MEELVNIGYIDENTGDELLRVLLYRHNYVDQKVIKWTNINNQNSHSSYGYMSVSIIESPCPDSFRVAIQIALYYVTFIIIGWGGPCT